MALSFFGIGMQTDLFQSVATAEIFQIRVIKGATVILSIMNEVSSAPSSTGHYYLESMLLFSWLLLIEQKFKLE